MEPHYQFPRAALEQHAAQTTGVEERIFDATGRPAAFSSANSATTITALNTKKKTKRKKDVQLWVTVVEGIGFPDNLKESYVKLHFGNNILIGKSTKSSPSSPKWGETFVLDRRDEEEHLVLQVHATLQGHFLSFTFMSITLPVAKIIRRVQVYRWFKPDPQKPPAILLLLRCMPTEPVLRHHRLHSMRIELHSPSVAAGGVFKGCIIYAANRPRCFLEAYLVFQHGTWLLPGPASGTKDKNTHLEYFNVKFLLPHKFPYDACVSLNEYEIPPGLYLWPFRIELPDQMYKTETSRAAFSGKDWSTYCQFAVCFRFTNSTKKFSWTPLCIDGAPAPPLFMKTDDIPANTAIQPPDIKFFSEAPFSPDLIGAPHSSVHFEPYRIEERVPISGCSLSVAHVLYPDLTPF